MKGLVSKLFLGVGYFLRAAKALRLVASGTVITDRYLSLWPTTVAVADVKSLLLTICCAFVSLMKMNFAKWILKRS